MNDILNGASAGIQGLLHAIPTALAVPVSILLVCGAAFSIIAVGSLLGELATEHVHFRVFLPKLVDRLKRDEDAPEQTIKESGLLMRQKRYLIELTRHPDLTDQMRESLAVSLEFRERSRYDGIVKLTDLGARIFPMLGLLGTLIHLGPGIVALGEWQTDVLSQALATAFDSTSAGLIAAVVCMVVSAVRKRWYKAYMVAFDTCMECVLETEKARARHIREGRVARKDDDSAETVPVAYKEAAAIDEAARESAEAGEE